MIKKMNNKGFTLVELLATIAILAIISTITIVAVVSYYQKSKEESEEIFYNQLENYVEDYISLYGSTLSYNTTGTLKQKCYTSTTGTEVCNNVTLFSATSNPGIVTIANNFVNKDLINPSTEVECTNSNIKVSVYRDTDFVYCFKIEKKTTTSCISKTIDTCTNLYN